jgi:hypothetical protein
MSWFISAGRWTRLLHEWKELPGLTRRLLTTIIQYYVFSQEWGHEATVNGKAAATMSVTLEEQNPGKRVAWCWGCGKVELTELEQYGQPIPKDWIANFNHAWSACLCPTCQQKEEMLLLFQRKRLHGETEIVRFRAVDNLTFLDSEEVTRERIRRVYNSCIYDYPPADLMEKE